MQRSIEEKLKEVRTRLQEVADLRGAQAVLGWDQATYMPPGGAADRGQQMATLGRLAHEKFTDPELGKLLDDLQTYEDDQPFESDIASLLRVTRRQYEQSVLVPPSFTAEMAAHAAESYSVWAAARPENDFARTRPYLEKGLDLSRQYADFFPGYEHPADPLINVYDYGMTATTVRAIFSQLRDRLVPLVEAICAQTPADDSSLHKHYPEAAQWGFGMMVAQKFGYDLNRGRQDKTLHPFATRLAHGDVRITTRFQESNLAEGMFGTMHETGHALYEQGVSLDLEGTPLAGGTSAAVHESQSRLWENIVGRSLGFWSHFYPTLQQSFPKQLGNVPLDEFYRAVNKVERSLIRTDADEVTYNLHVIIRFDLELDLLEGKLSIAELPEAWHARYQQDLGRRAPDDRNGVLQDVHWFAGTVGGSFQGYALGNILASQFYAAALAAHPEIPQEIERGEFDTLHRWLQTNIYAHGSKFTTDELVQRVTGGPLQVGPYFDYLQAKYGALYQLG